MAVITAPERDARPFLVRAELPDGYHEDFTVMASRPTAARHKAEKKLLQQMNATNDMDFEWRGMVVFVRQGPKKKAAP